MKKKNIFLISIAIVLLIFMIAYLILTYGYGGGNAVKPVDKSVEFIRLEREIKKETQYEGSYIDSQKNYEIENCEKSNLRQEVFLVINNKNLQNEIDLNNYTVKLNGRIQKIFPYNKNCYDSVIIKTQFFKDGQMTNKRYSFVMVKSTK